MFNKPGWYRLIVAQFLEAASCSVSDLLGYQVSSVDVSKNISIKTVK